jgi:recombination protein RecA
MNQFISKTNKQFGIGTAITASEIVSPPRLTSGSLSLDVILGGGWPANGQWVEIRGKESAGKTAIAFKTIAANQRINQDFTTLWIAAEAYDVDQANALGVDNARVTVIPTQAMEFAFEMMVDGASSQEFDLIVLDSYPALVPDEEAEKSMDEFTTAMGARNFNKFIRKAGLASKRAADGTDRPLTGIIINQYRDKIGGFSRYGVPQTTPGGHGKDYFYYTIVKVARDDWITEKRTGNPDPVAVGQTIKLTTEKNKANAPRQTISLDFYFREAPVIGFHRGDYDSAKDFFTMGVLFGIIKKAGMWYSYNGEKWQGKEKALEAIRQDRALQDDLAVDVLNASGDATLADQLVTTEED